MPIEALALALALMSIAHALPILRVCDRLRRSRGPKGPAVFAKGAVQPFESARVPRSV